MSDRKQQEADMKYYGKNYDYVMKNIKDVELEKKYLKKNMHMQTCEGLPSRLILIKMLFFKVIIFGLKIINFCQQI